MQHFISPTAGLLKCLEAREETLPASGRILHLPPPKSIQKDWVFIAAPYLVYLSSATKCMAVRQYDEILFHFEQIPLIIVSIAGFFKHIHSHSPLTLEASLNETKIHESLVHDQSLSFWKIS